MSRLAGKEKAQYYRTQDRIIPLILRHVVFNGSNTHGGIIFDPCIGEGLAAKELADQLNAPYGDRAAYAHKLNLEKWPGGVPRYSWEKPWTAANFPEGERWVVKGIELDHTRAMKAKALIGDSSVWEGAFEQFAPLDKSQAKVIFLNPPYDDHGYGRMEIEFVRMASMFMGGNTLMILIVPEHILTKEHTRERLSQALRGKTSTIRVLRYPEPEYDQFKQVVCLIDGGGSTPREYSWRVVGELGDVPDEAQDRPHNYRELINMISCHDPVNMKFGLTRLGDAPVESVFVNGIPEQFYPYLGEPERPAVDMRPVMEMGDAHGAMVAAAGALNGLEITDTNGDRLLVRGSSYKATITEEVEHENGDVDTIEIEKYVARMATLNLDRLQITTADSHYSPDDFENLLLKHADEFVRAAHDMFPPLLTDQYHNQIIPEIDQVRAPRKLKGKDNGLFPEQRERVAAILKVWQNDQCATLDGEMSTGKTVMSLAAAAVKAQRRSPGKRHILVMLPPKDDLLRKWGEEANRALRLFNPTVHIIGIKQHCDPINRLRNTSIADGILRDEDDPKRKVIPLHEPDPDKKRTSIMPYDEIDAAFAERGLNVILVKSTTVKMGGGWRPVPLVIKTRWVVEDKGYRYKPENLKSYQKVRQESNGLWTILKKTRVGYCPSCSQEIEHALRKGRERRCIKCGDSLWEEATTKVGWRAKTPLARYIRKRYSKRYILIVDEAHETKSPTTAISLASTDLTTASYKMLQMTATLFGGKASSLFPLMYRTSHDFRRLYPYNGTQKFINDYGLYERITRTYAPKYTGTTYSGYKDKTFEKHEIAGIAPGMAMLLLPQAAFISLRDLAHEMPAYSEHTLFVDPESEYKAAVNDYLDACKKEAVQAKKDDNHSPMGQYRMARIGITNIPMGPDTIEISETDWVVYNHPDVPRDHIFRKEEAFLRLVWDAKVRGRKVLTFVGQIKRRDPTPRLLGLLERFGMKGTVMEAKVKKDRAGFLQRAYRSGSDVCFCTPQLVSVGIDLPFLATIIWYTPEYNVYVMPQANRRPYRLQQEQDVEVYYLANNDLPEAAAFAYIAEKIAAQQALRGDIRAGLARVLGQDTFVSRLQDAVTDIVHFESDMGLDDLPTLPTAAEIEAQKPKPKPVPVIKTRTVTVEPAGNGKVKVTQQTGQLTFGQLLERTKKKKVTRTIREGGIDDKKPTQLSMWG